MSIEDAAARLADVLPQGDAGHRAPDLYEQITADCVGFYVRSTRRAPRSLPSGRECPPGRARGRRGAAAGDATASFQGYRLLQEYFAFPERFLFFSLHDLRAGCARLRGRRARDLSRDGPRAAGGSRTRSMRATSVCSARRRSTCCRARADRIHVSAVRHRVSPRRRSQPADGLRDLQPREAAGHRGAAASRSRRSCRSIPSSHRTDPPVAGAVLHAAAASAAAVGAPAAERRARRLCRQRVFHLHRRLCAAAARAGDIRQIDAQALCTNRDLPVQMALGQGRTDFHRRRRRSRRVRALYRRAELSARTRPRSATRPGS